MSVSNGMIHGYLKMIFLNKLHGRGQWSMNFPPVRPSSPGSDKNTLPSYIQGSKNMSGSRYRV